MRTNIVVIHKIIVIGNTVLENTDHEREREILVFNICTHGKGNGIITFLFDSLLCVENIKV